MTARAIWKGVLRLPGAPVPVKLYSAVADRRVHFRLLHETDHVPVRQVMVNPESDEAVPPERMRKAYEAEPGVFVVLEEEDLEELEPEASRDIEITRFVPPEALDHRWYDRPYYLGPDDGAGGGYAALARALGESGREGVARWVMRKREYVGALRARGEHLLLVTLRHPREVISASHLEASGGRDLGAGERKMAEQLVAALSGPLDLADFEDTYRQRVLELVEKKAEGGEVELPAPARRRREPASLAAALEASLEKLAGEERRSA